MKALFAASRDSLGSRTMMKNLRGEGFAIGRDRTRRLMKAMGLSDSGHCAIFIRTSLFYETRHYTTFFH
jgi:hypothetical protein